MTDQTKPMDAERRKSRLAALSDNPESPALTDKEV